MLSHLLIDPPGLVVQALRGSSNFLAGLVAVYPAVGALPAQRLMGPVADLMGLQDMPAPGLSSGLGPLSLNGGELEESASMRSSACCRAVRAACSEASGSVRKIFSPEHPFATG